MTPTNSVEQVLTESHRAAGWLAALGDSDLIRAIKTSASEKEEEEEEETGED